MRPLAYSVYAVLLVSESCERKIKSVLKNLGVAPCAIQKNLHLTIYHARRPISGLSTSLRKIQIRADVAETRFMVLRPGGENPRSGVIPNRCSIGIRLTKRNSAVEQILCLRKQMYQHETQEIIGQRRRTTRWTNAFGARHYQPHIKLLHPGNGADDDLKIIGHGFRAQLESIQFDRLKICCGPVSPKKCGK